MFDNFLDVQNYIMIEKLYNIYDFFCMLSLQPRATFPYSINYVKFQ